MWYEEHLVRFLGHVLSFSEPVVVIESENRKQNRITFIVQKPVSSAVGSDGHFFSLFTQKIKRAFRTEHFTAAASPRLTGDGSPPNLQRVCSTKLRVFAAEFEGRRWSVSRGLAWDVGALPISG